MSKDKLTTKPTSVDALTPKPSGKPKAQVPLPTQSSLDMLTSAIGYMRESGIDIEIRQHPQLGALIKMPNIQALADDWFEPLPNSLPN